MEDENDSIRRLRAREDVRRLLFDYARFIDAGDIDLFAELFAAQAEWIGPRSHLVGREEIRRHFGGRVSGQSSFHLVANSQIDLEDDCSTGRVWSLFAYITQGLGNDGPRLDTFGHYEDVVGVEGGAWRFLRRQVFHDIPARHES